MKKYGSNRASLVVNGMYEPKVMAMTVLFPAIMGGRDKSFPIGQWHIWVSPHNYMDKGLGYFHI